MNGWNHRPFRRKALRLVPLALALSGSLSAQAAAAAPTAYEFHVGAGSLRAALNSYARVTRRQLLYPSALVAGRRSPALRGRFTADEALARLLAGSNIAIRSAGPNVFVLAASTPSPAAQAPRSVQRPARGKTSAPQAPAGQPGRREPEAGRTAIEEEIVVTGTNIRAAGERASQVLVIGREDIARSGYGTVAEALAALPQNFGGTATEDTSLTGADRAIPNSSLGSSVNLRGLGSDATLTLVNGRRVAGSGAKGDFTDLSFIPTGAVERVEILTDGASALYGSDAIGGVVNIILRRRLEGGESRVRVGTATQGGATDYQLGQLLGTAWRGGHLLAAYEFQRRENLAARDRRYTRSADLRPLGGNDFRFYFSNPGTLLGFDPATGNLVPSYAIPAGQDGTNLQPGDFIPGQNLENQNAGIDLLPRQTRHGLYVTAEQEVGASLRLFLEGRYAHRRFFNNNYSSMALMLVTSANPFFVSPDGSPSSLVAYSFSKELDPITTRGFAEAWSVTGGGALELGGDWLLDAYLMHAREKTRSRTENALQSSYLDEALGNIADDPDTPFSTSNGGFFNPYGDGAVNSAEILDFISQGYSDERIDSDITSVNFKADGTLFEWPGGSVRAAFGATYRREALFRRGESFFFGDAVEPLIRADVDRTIKAVFGELLVPIFGSSNGRRALRRLELSAAVRHENYSDFGSSTNPKFGLLWEPVRGLAFRGTYGTSFRAPALRESGDPLSVSATQLPDATGAFRPVLFLSGGNPDLEPERARSITLGVKFAPPAAAGFRAEANYFHTRFSNRIGQPAFEDLLNVLRDNIYSPFVEFISPANDPADRATVVDLISRPGASVPSFFPPEVFGAIVDGRYVNTAKVIVRGIDLVLTKSFRLGEAEATLGANGSYLFDFKRQVTPLAPLLERVDTLGNPVDLRLRATGNLGWRDWGATASINHAGAYTDNVSSPSRRIESWTTLDLQVRYEPKATDWRRGLIVSLSVQNLLDDDPPFVNRSAGFGYDATNADPLGRFVALQVVKSW